MSSVLSLSDVCWRYEDGASWTLAGIDLSLTEGEVVGLVGLSGAGKTTLLLAMAGLIPANYAGQFSGRRSVQGELGIVFQDPETQFIGLTVEEEIAFSLENRGQDDRAIERRIEDVLALVGLSGFASRSPFELSGGEKQRVAIASALAHAPKLLLLDEPTSELDPKGAREVFSLIRRLKVEERMTILVASHATEELAQFCDRMLLIADGAIVMDMPADAFFSQVASLDAHGIHVPDMVRLYHALCTEGVLDEKTTPCPRTVEDMLTLWQSLVRKGEVAIP